MYVMLITKMAIVYIHFLIRNFIPRTWYHS